MAGRRRPSTLQGPEGRLSEEFRAPVSGPAPIRSHTPGAQSCQKVLHSTGPSRVPWGSPQEPKPRAAPPAALYIELAVLNVSLDKQLEA